jgi:hypothetical protein
MTNNDYNDRIISLEKRVTELEESLRGISRNSTVVKPQDRMSVNEFIRTKKLDDDVKRTLTIAYYLDYFEKMESFNGEDLKKWFRLAKLAIPKNINDKVNMNVKNGHLAELEEKKDSKKAWYVTNSGAEYVEKNLHVSK